jgi:hypothetical protein
VKQAPLFFLVAGALCAQQTVVQKLFTNDTSGNITTSATLIKNVGQIGHTVVAQFSGAGCNPATNLATLEFDMSFDGSTWYPVGQPQTSGGSYGFVGATATVTATALANYYRVVLTWNGANCVGSAWYNATTSTSMVQTVQGIVANGGVLGSGGQPVVVGGLSSTGTVRPLNSCDSFEAITATPATPMGITGAPSGTWHLRVCAIGLSMTANGTIQFVSGTNAGCSAGVIALTPAITLNAGAPFTVGNGLGSVMNIDYSGGKYVCLLATGGNANGFISYSQNTF